MEIGVRWVYQQVKDKRGVVLEAGQKPALCFKARKFMLCVTAGHPVRILKRLATDMEKCRMVTYEGGEYTIARAVQQFEQIGARNGITAGAQKLLQRAVDMVEELDENEFNDEEDIAMKSEKTAEEVATNLTQEGEGGDTGAVESTNTTEDSNMTSTSTTTPKAKRVRKDKPAAKSAAKKTVKAKSNGNGAAKKPYIPSADSKMGKAVAFMRQEIKEAGGVNKLERGFLKDLFERTAKKTGCAVATAQTQYNAQIRHKPGT